MNNRYQQLALQAAELAKQENEHYDDRKDPDYLTRRLSRYNRVYAELIVRTCAQVAETLAPPRIQLDLVPQLELQLQQAHESALAVLRHFGLEPK